jgi:hypothetical protein
MNTQPPIDTLRCPACAIRNYRGSTECQRCREPLAHLWAARPVIPPAPPRRFPVGIVVGIVTVAAVAFVFYSLFGPKPNPSERASTAAPGTVPIAASPGAPPPSAPRAPVASEGIVLLGPGDAPPSLEKTEPGAASKSDSTESPAEGSDPSRTTGDDTPVVSTYTPPRSLAELANFPERYAGRSLIIGTDIAGPDADIWMDSIPVKRGMAWCLEVREDGGEYIGPYLSSDKIAFICSPIIAEQILNVLVPGERYLVELHFVVQKTKTSSGEVWVANVTTINALNYKKLSKWTASGPAVSLS